LTQESKKPEAKHAVDKKLVRDENSQADETMSKPMLKVAKNEVRSDSIKEARHTSQPE
jgi:hypothetical protein